MSREVKCSQLTCFAVATHRYTWPGSPEQPSCYEHALTAQRIAQAMSFELQILPECLLCSSVATIFAGGSAYCHEHARSGERPA